MQGLEDVKPLIADLKVYNSIFIATNITSPCCMFCQARVTSLTEEKAALEAEHASAILRRREAQLKEGDLKATANALKVVSHLHYVIVNRLVI